MTNELKDNAVSKPPLVTVYITNFNYGEYIKQSVESVLVQTMTDFELIIIDDGSSDNSHEIIREYESLPNVRCIFQHNKGLNVTNNIAMRTARGKYLMRLDADDWLDPHALELLSNVLDRNKEVGLVFPDYYHVDREGRVIDQVRRHKFEDVSLLDQPAHGACTMIRCECLSAIGGYDESFSCQDGYDLWIRFVEHYEVKNVSLPLFYYRQHGKSLTDNEERILSTRAKIIQKITSVNRQSLRVLAVIVVRGPLYDNSSFAMKDLGGKKLIDWTIEAACNASRVKKVVLSTPDESVFEHVHSLQFQNFDVIKRPIEYAKTNLPIQHTLRHALEVSEADGEEYDAILQLAVESPFRGAQHIDTTIEAMELFDTNVVFGVRRENDNFYQHNGHGLKPVSQSERLRLEREDIYREVGSMRLLKKEEVFAPIELTGSKVGHVELDQMAALRLVSEFDWKIAEIVARWNKAT